MQALSQLSYGPKIGAGILGVVLLSVNSLATPNHLQFRAALGPFSLATARSCILEL